MGKDKAARWLGASLCALAFGVAAQGVPTRNARGRVVDGQGRTLYVYDADTVPGHSACVGPCASVWPPYAAAGAAQAQGDFGLIAREQGRQWSWHGHPLYRYAGDSKPGDTLGDGINGNWHVAH